MSGLIAAEGAFHRLRLPVLTLGSGAAADVTLAGLAELHCIIAPTPAGPALRSFADGVRVNGEPAMAALLKHGDMIEAGTHSFTMAWHGHNLETEVQRVLDELNDREAGLNATEAELRERGESLAEEKSQFDACCAERHAALAAQFEHDQSEQRSLLENQKLQLDRVREALSSEHDAHEVRLAELGQHREVFAAERRAFAEQVTEVQSELEREREAVNAAKIEAELRLDDTREKHEAAKAVETRTRSAAAKYLVEQRAVIEQERQQLRDLHLALSTQRGQIDQLRQTHVQEAAALRGETEAVNARVAAAWSAIADGQAQIAMSRATAEAEIARHTAALDARKAHLDEREATLGVGQKVAADKLHALQSEFAGLEPRVAAARKALAELETQRIQNTPAKMDEWVVPLTVQRDGRSADQLMLQLRQQEAEIGRERQRLAAQLHQAATEREQLAEQRGLVAEQVRSHEIARRQWKDAETQNLAEIEQMARMLTQREAELEARAKTMTQGSLQHDQLSTLKATLDAWQRSQEVKAPSVVTFRSTPVSMKV